MSKVALSCSQDQNEEQGDYSIIYLPSIRIYRLVDHFDLHDIQKHRDTKTYSSTQSGDRFNMSSRSVTQELIEGVAGIDL